MALSELQVGALSVSGTAKTVARAGQQGDLIVSELHGRYYEQAYRGNMYSVCTQGTGITTTAALATTFTGLAIGNPSTSGVNLVLNKFTCAQFAVGAASFIASYTAIATTSALQFSFSWEEVPV